MQSLIEALSPSWVPHKGQLAFLESQAPINVLACGRRWGKTDACAVKTLLTIATCESSRHLFLAPTLDQAKLLFDRVLSLWSLLGDRWSGDKPWIKPSVRRTPYAHATIGGHRVVARSGHIGRSLRGNEATHIIVDEAAFVPEELVTEVAMPMLATSKGTLTLISTPRGLNHFWRFFRMGVEGRSQVWSRTAPSAESPLVSQEYLALQRELISERAYRTEYGAEFLESQGRVFRTESIDAATRVQLERDADSPIWIGVDWARYHDYTAVVAVSGTRQEAQVVECARFHAMSWAEQIQKVAEIIKRYPGARILCDATGMGDPLLESLQVACPNAPIEGATFTSQFKSNLIDNLAWMFENHALTMQPNVELIRELQHFESVQRGSGPARLEASSGFHDDLVIALALACWQAPTKYRPSIILGGPRQFSADKRSRARKLA